MLLPPLPRGTLPHRVGGTFVRLLGASAPPTVEGIASTVVMRGLVDSAVVVTALRRLMCMFQVNERTRAG